MDDKGVFDHQYERFHKDRQRGEGYDFQRGPAGSEPVPKVSFAEKLRWWAIDRWKRRRKLLEERDRRQQDILNIKNRRTP